MRFIPSCHNIGTVGSSYLNDKGGLVVVDSGRLVTSNDFNETNL